MIDADKRGWKEQREKRWEREGRAGEEQREASVKKNARSVRYQEELGEGW